VLFLVELELVETIGDRQPVDAREPVEGKQRIVRIREGVEDAVDEAVPASLGDRVPLGDRPLAPFAADPTSEPAPRRRSAPPAGRRA
jgi:hypothetical protein